MLDGNCCVRALPRLSRGPVAVLVGAVLLVGLGASEASADAPCSSALHTLSAANQPSCWRPFVDSSPINTALPANPTLAPNNAAVQQHMADYGWHLQGSSTGFQLSGDGSRAVYFASAQDPVLTVNCTSQEGPNTCQGSNGTDVNGAQIHVPAGAKPGNNWDAHMIVVETATGQEYDFWHTSISGSTLTAGTGAVENIATTDGTQDSGDAASLALTAGLLRPSELASGQINHALVVTVPCTYAHGPDTGYSWPAAGGWGETCGDYWGESPAGAPAIGQLFKLDMTDGQIAASGAPRWEQTIMTALAHYGAYAEDTNGSWRDEGMHIIAQDPISWTSLGQPDQWARTIDQLGGHGDTLSSSIAIPTSHIEVVDPCVPRGTCPNAGPVINANRSAGGGHQGARRLPRARSASGKARGSRRHHHHRHHRRGHSSARHSGRRTGPGRGRHHHGHRRLP